MARSVRSHARHSRRGPPSRPRHGTFAPGRAFGRAVASTPPRKRPWSPVGSRLLKYLKRLVIVLLVLVALGVGVFTWVFHWPLEGDVEDILQLVPHDVEFVLRADYQDLESTGWVQTNLLDNPIQLEARTALRAALDQVHAELRRIQAQVDAQSPISVDVETFLEDNVLAGEVCIAGNWWEQASPEAGPPQWKDLLVLKRIKGLARCISGLKHGFIRNQLQLGPMIELSAESDEVFKFTLHEMKRIARTSPVRPGVVAPDMSEWYLVRVKDVVAVSNRRKLVDRVLELGDDPNDPDTFARRPGFDIQRRDGRIVAAINVAPLHTYFGRLFNYYPELKHIKRFLPPQALEKLSGFLSLAGLDLLEGGAPISYIAANAEDVVRNVYNLAERPVSEGIARMVPAKDTFAVLSLRCDPGYLFDLLREDIMTPVQRKLWEDNFRKMNTEFADLDAFFQDLSTRIGDEAMIAVARLSTEYDKIDYTEWYTGDPDPMPSVAIMVRIREGANQAELDQYIANKVPLLGLSKNLDRIEYNGFTYSRTRLEQQILDFKFFAPCFILANDHLVMTTTEEYMRQILDTVSDHTKLALAQDETFRVTMAALPERGHVGIFVDLEKLTRIPEEVRWDPRPDMGAPGARGFLWDGRNQWVIRERDERTEAIRYRREVAAKYPAQPNPQQQQAIERQVDAHMDAWMQNYPRFIEEYRRDLERWRRLRGFGLVLGATSDRIDTHFALVLRPGERWLHWRR